MQWLEKEVQIKDLKDYKNNPRSISKEEFEKIVNSIKEDGYHQRIMVDLDGTIIGGHQRKKALKKAGFKDKDIIKVLMPERKLTEEEFKRLNIRDNGSFGDWDVDIIANNFDDIDQLIDWGIPSDIFKDLFTEEKVKKEKKFDNSGKERSQECPVCGYEFSIKIPE